MLTPKQLKDKGIEYELSFFKWLPRNYKLETSEFTEDGSFNEVDFLTYLTLWELRLNHQNTVITARNDKGEIISRVHQREYYIIRDRYEGNWYYTLVKIKGGIEEDA